MALKICSAALVGLALLAPRAMAAETYPDKPIHVIVPVPAGALTDVISRRIAADASARMGQPWIMENKPGANFLPAAETCHYAKPDGYTLCIFTTSTLTFNPHLIDKLPYDPARDFKAIMNLGMLTGGLVASPKLQLKNIDELRKLALEKPGVLNFGTYGPASSANVFRQFLNDRWKTNIVEVGYKGSNELLAALVAGEIQMTWTALGTWADNPGDAKGKIMVSDAARRLPKIPDVPIYQEAGFGDFPIRTWFGLFAPAGVPDAIINQVNDAVAKTIADPKVAEFLANQLIEPAISSAPDFTAYVDSERVATGKIFERYSIPKIQ